MCIIHATLRNTRYNAARNKPQQTLHSTQGTQAMAMQTPAEFAKTMTYSLHVKNSEVFEQAEGYVANDDELNCVDTAAESVFTLEQVMRVIEYIILHVDSDAVCTIAAH